ncbi:MAG TPA: FAD-dependent oxidoreductase [Candidatus Latescibacteria bacterium]|nr:FAD-dependent oxidoreductase [Candidatus Latescibacterota bacterium]HPK75404.1 FAD-dependent oxidoreductase [Candidatus Latescibacterota bacterium]
MPHETLPTVRLPAQQVPVMADADVVVVGGGTSGFIAAVAAARTGASVLLVEKAGYLGGCTTAPYNTGLSQFFDSDGNQIIRGLPWEFMKRMEADGNAFLVERRNEIWPVWTRKVALDMMEEAGAEFLFHTWTSGVVRDGDAVRGIIVHNKGGTGVILGKCFVDATGDADIAAFAGAPFDMTEVENLQQVSCDYIACGVDHVRVLEWARANRDRLDLRVSNIDMEPRSSGVQRMLTIVLPHNAKDPVTGEPFHVGVMPTVKLCIHRDAVRIQGNSDINPLDPKALTRAEADGLRGALKHLQNLRDTIPGFEDAYIVAQSHLGVRETRRIIGDYVLTIDDLRGNARFDDVVALNCRGLDYHLKGTVFKYTGLKGHHDVPLRALLPKNVENLLVAGRSIACDHLSQASLRGAATCLATGQAAGVAAALAAKQGGKVRGVDICLIQKTLVRQDAVLGVGERARLFE